VGFDYLDQNVGKNLGKGNLMKHRERYIRRYVNTLRPEDLIEDDFSDLEEIISSEESKKSVELPSTGSALELNENRDLEKEKSQEDSSNDLKNISSSELKHTENKKKVVKFSKIEPTDKKIKEGKSEKKIKDREKYEKMTKKDLFSIAKDRGIYTSSRLSKSDIIDFLILDD